MFFSYNSTSSGPFGFSGPRRVTRESLGLLSVATHEDFSRSIEVSGEPTDLNRLAFAHAHNVPYDQVRRR